MNDNDDLRITYYVKNNMTCPVCEKQYPREELRSGGGRLIAGKLTDELRRLYEPSKKYGKVNPLVYPVSVCPNCLFAAFPEDLPKLPPENAEPAKRYTEKRMHLVMQTFGQVDFDERRDEAAGCASYLLAVNSYSFFNKNVSPTIKKGMCALRAAWMLGDMEAEDGGGKYGYIQQLMYRKARDFYERMMGFAQTGEETIEGVKIGPDTDKNWGYEGFLYIAGILQFKLGYLEKDLEVRGKKFLETKRVIAKLFGRGKASKSKPSEILDMSRDLYDQIGTQLSQIEEELGTKFD